jgi:DNA-binding beta-propeller fold protein YncE
MVRDAAGQFLFVIDQGSYPPPGYPTPSQTNPSCPHVPTSATDVCPSISVFAIQPSLTLESGSPFYLSKIPTALSAITFTPSSPAGSPAQELLFVTNNEDICSQNCIFPSPHNDNTVSVYSVSSPAGVLTEQPNSPYAIAAANPISVQAVNTNPAGEDTGGLFVYVGNQGPTVGALNPFQVCWLQNANCSQQDVAGHLMVPLATCPLLSCDIPPSSVGQNPVAMLVDPTNNFLYVVSEGSSQVFGFLINRTVGTLTALSPPYQPTGTSPVSMAMHPNVNSAGQALYNYNTSGQFLYTSNTVSSNITGFTLSTTSGSMSSPTTTVAPAAPSGIAVH